MKCLVGRSIKVRPRQRRRKLEAKATSVDLNEKKCVRMRTGKKVRRRVLKACEGYKCVCGELILNKC